MYLSETQVKMLGDLEFLGSQFFENKMILKIHLRKSWANFLLCRMYSKPDQMHNS